MTGRELIEKNAAEIIAAMKSGTTFTHDDLLFLTRFFRQLADMADTKLKDGGLGWFEK